jgi:hypothetical protein
VRVWRSSACQRSGSFASSIDVPVGELLGLEHQRFSAGLRVELPRPSLDPLLGVRELRLRVRRHACSPVPQDRELREHVEKSVRRRRRLGREPVVERAIDA